MKRAVIVMMIGVLTASIACAVPDLTAGTKEFYVAGFFDGNNPLDYQFDLDGGCGVFVKDNWEVLGVAGIHVNDAVSVLGIGAATEYNFVADSEWVPFVGVGLLWGADEMDDSISNDAERIDESTLLVRLSGGVKYFLKPDVAVSLHLDYDQSTDDIYPDQDGNLDDYTWGLKLGMRLFWE